MASQTPVVVVGGGPGGSATAISLRRHGVPVVLLDRAVFPRDKVCGDVVLPQAQDALRALGLPWEELRARALTCTGSRYVAPGGAEVSGDFSDATGTPRPWWIVKRLVLDAWLLEQARLAGADVRVGHEVRDVVRGAGGRAEGVTVKGPDGAVRVLAASAVVGADGASSAVARSLGVFRQDAPHLCLAVRAYVKAPRLPQPYLEIFTTPRSLPGCAWILPVSDGEWNVGAGIIKADAQRLGTSPAAMFQEIRETVPLFRQRLAGLEIPTLKGWSLPGSSEGRPLVGNGHLLVGDAGAMVDPFTGHGIHHALMAGRHAGVVLAQALRNGDVSAAALMDYDRRCRAEFLDESARGRLLQRVHSSATAMRLATRLCGVHPGAHWAFLALLGHSATRRDVVGLRTLFSRGATLQAVAS